MVLSSLSLIGCASSLASSALVVCSVSVIVGLFCLLFVLCLFILLGLFLFVSIFLSLSSDVSPVFGLVRTRVVVTVDGVVVGCSFCPFFLCVWFL